VRSQAQIGTSLMENDEILISISRAESTEENEKIKTERHDALILMHKLQPRSHQPGQRPDQPRRRIVRLLVVLFLFCGLYKGEWKPRIRIKAKRAKVHRKKEPLVACWMLGLPSGLPLGSLPFARVRPLLEACFGRLVWVLGCCSWCVCLFFSIYFSLIH